MSGKRFVFLSFIYCAVAFGTSVSNNAPSQAVTTSTDIQSGPKTTREWGNLLTPDTGVIGNGMNSMGSMGQSAYSSTPDQLTNTAVNQNANLKNINSMGSYTGALNTTMATAGANNPITSGNLNWSGSIKCYITRDVPYGYKCPYTGLSYGGIVTGDISKFQKECKQDCYQSMPCQNIASNVSTPPPITSESFNASSYAFTVATDSSQRLNNISFTTSFNQTSTLLVQVSYINLSGQTIKIASNFKISGGNINPTYFYFGNYAQSVTITVSTLDNSSQNVQINNIAPNYGSGDRWYCPQKQDLSMVKGGNFSSVCPSGKTITGTYADNQSGSQATYTLCVNSNGQGDNQDGTFSSNASCNNFCRQTYDCVSDLSAINTQSLQAFNEGCIDGQPNCSNINRDCKNARLSPNATVKNERVFDATENSYATVVNGAQVSNVYRPRLLLDDSVSFEKRTAQEEKDQGYQNMFLANTYNYTSVNIGDNTPISNAYEKRTLSGSDYGFPGTAIDALYWKTKPAALDVNVGATYNLYSVVILDLTYYDNAVQKIDEIWYAKQNGGDSFYPFRRSVNRYSISGVSDASLNTLLKLSLNVNATLNYQSFSSSWGALNAAGSFPAFVAETFQTPQVFYSYPIINNINNMSSSFPGIITSMSGSPSYGGTPDGSGQAIVKYRVYAFYSSQSYSYADIGTMIDNQTLNPIYELGSETAYPNVLKSDSLENNDVEIYMYGPANSQTDFMNITPNPKDVGKVGFIYVFTK